MNGASRFVGRLAVLQNITDDEPFNGLYVTVSSYSAQTGLYLVAGDNVEANVQFSQLKFFTSVDFFERYPDAPFVDGGETRSAIPAASVLDLRSVRVRPPLPPKLTITDSCYVLGNAQHPTPLVDMLVIDTEDGIVEIEGILFQGDGSEGHVRCMRGEIVFRSCMFNDDRIGAIGELGHVGTLNIVFENCAFSNHKECGVLLEGGLAIFVNCRFQSVGFGLSIQENATAKLYHCAFKSCVGGLVLPCKGEVSMYQCMLEEMNDFGVLASNGSTVTMNSCTVSSCLGDGVVVEGGDNSDVIVVNCKIVSCKMGVRMGNGKVQVTIHNTSFLHCATGLYTAVDTVGIVSEKLCVYNSCIADRVDISGNKCEVTADGNFSGGGTQLSRLQQMRYVIANTGTKYGYPISGTGARVLHEAGIMIMSCAKCDQVIILGGSKRGGQCRHVRYCSKACQKAHWLPHAMICWITRTKANLFSSRGYITCLNCGQVEKQTGNAPSLLPCGRCVSVFYCNKACQQEDWKYHRQKCVKRNVLLSYYSH